MLKSFLIIALRNLRKHKGYAVINVAGLAIGMACCILIMLYVKDELSYDRYHENAERLYRVSLHGRIAGNEVHVTHTCAPMAAALVNEFPEVAATTRLRRSPGSVLVARGDERFNESRVFFADSTYFDVFTLPLIHGDPATALTRPYSVILTRDAARKYFGEENPIGQTLTFEDRRDYEVTGVSENVPANSHFHFDLLASFTSLSSHSSTRWISNNLQTYLLLAKNNRAEDLEAKLPDLIRKYVAPQIQQAMGVSFDEFIRAGGDYRYGLQKVTDIHLRSKLGDEIEPTGNAAYVVIFALVAAIILILACINFMNLATARSANRSKEVGLRKVVGSNQLLLIRQFLTESILLSCIAALLAVLLVEFFMSEFNQLTAKQITTDYLGDPWLIPGLLFITLFVGFLAGSYPAFYLASFKPIAVLKGRLQAGMKRSKLRGGLVIFQFAISVVLIICTLVIANQMRFVRNKQLGFDKEQVIVIQRAGALEQKFDSFKQSVQAHPQIVSVSETRHIPGQDGDTNAYKPEDGRDTDAYLLRAFTVGHDFIETLGIEITTGRSFSRTFSTDSSAYVINEAAVRQFGWTEAVGRTIIEPDPSGQISGKVIGVMQDFHFESLHQVILPALMRLGDNPRYVCVKITGDEISQTVAHLEEKWREFASGQPFEYGFLDDQFDMLYRADQRVGNTFATFAILGILIACLGLFGLASFSAEQRTKEIGIRKALGASVGQILYLLSLEFSRLVLFAFMAAVPIAYLAMDRWLQNFAYRIDMNWMTFLLAGAIALVIAWVTVSFQSVRAALANPVKSLRYE